MTEFGVGAWRPLLAASLEQNKEEVLQGAALPGPLWGREGGSLEARWKGAWEWGGDSEQSGGFALQTPHPSFPGPPQGRHKCNPLRVADSQGRQGRGGATALAYSREKSLSPLSHMQVASRDGHTQTQQSHKAARGDRSTPTPLNAHNRKPSAATQTQAQWDASEG